MIYYIVFAALLLTQIAGKNRHEKWLYWFALIFLFGFSAFRNEVGCDWGNYLLNYNAAKYSFGMSATPEVNAAFWALLRAMNQLGMEYYWLNIITSAIFFAGLHAVARRTPRPLAVLVLAFPVLILNMPMSAVKQAAAIGLLCFAFNAFIDRRMLRFVGWTLLASMFHGSAVIFILLTPFVYGAYTRTNMIVAGLLALPGIYFVLGSDSVEMARDRYIGGSLDAGGAVYRAGLIAATGLFYTLFLRRRWARAFPDSYKLISILALGMIALAAVGPISSVIADRVAYYFAVPQILIYANLPSLYERRQGTWIKLAPYVALTLLLVAWVQFSSHYKWCYADYSLVPQVTLT